MYTAWMLRQDGKAFPVDYHLYSVDDDDLSSEVTIAFFLIKTNSKDQWFAREVIDYWLALLIEDHVRYNNTPEEIISIMKEQIKNFPDKFHYPLEVDEIIQIHREECSYNTFDELYDFLDDFNYHSNISNIQEKIKLSLNQQFCRVRYGGMYNTEVKNNNLWFRISSACFNWYDAIKNFIIELEKDLLLDKVTICRDNESDNGIDKSGDELIYRIFDENKKFFAFKDMPYKKCLTIIDDLKGKYSNCRNEGYSNFLSKGNTYFSLENRYNENVVLLSFNHIEYEIYNNCVICLPNNKYKKAKKHFYEPNGIKGLRVKNKAVKIYTGDAKILNIPNGITKIEACAFLCCRNLKEITIPKSVTEIQSEALACCDNLEKVTILNDNIKIDKDAFYGCDKLNEIISKNSKYKVVNGMLIYDEKILIQCSKNIKGDAYVPEGVTKIERGAFVECNKITTVILPKSLKKIEKGVAFHYCDKLNEVISKSSKYKVVDGMLIYDEKILIKCDKNKKRVAYVPEGVIEIGSGAFIDCDKIKTVILPKSLKKIEMYAFDDCANLEFLYLLNGKVKISINSFSSCEKLEIIRIDNTNKGTFEKLLKTLVL